MTDKVLYEHIRKLVRDQREEQATLDVRQENFAQEYCRFQMLKKRQARRQENRMNTLLKNFRNVDSYINIMDIISSLQLSLTNARPDQPTSADQQIPEIIPKTLQNKIREELAPILAKRYEEEGVKRIELMRELKEGLCCSAEHHLQQEKEASASKDKPEKFDLIDALRKDIKLKQVYFIERRFDRELDDIGRLPQKLEDTKLFHKICSYLHMVLEQEHKEKWASKQEQRFNEEHRKINFRSKVRIPTFIRNYSSSFRKTVSTNFRPSRQLQKADSDTLSPEEPIDGSQGHSFRSTTGNLQTAGNSPRKNARFQEDYLIEEEEPFVRPRESFKKVQSKQELLKETFTFRRRGIKQGLMHKINKFVDNLTDEEKKNIEVSKKYAKALQSLAEELDTSYGRFKREELAQEEDIEDMRRYLDNTLSRNKKDLKKFHHK